MEEVEVKIRGAIDVYKELLSLGYQFVIASSFGKDSETCLGLFINACIELMNEGATLMPQYLVTSSTLVENPEVEVLKYRKIKALKGFCEISGLPLEVVETSPSLANTWQVKIIGGKSLPTMTNSSHRQCTVDLKISASNAALKRIKKSIPKERRDKLCIVLGSRDSESVIRAKNIEKFDGSSTQVVSTPEGSFLYPIKDFLVDDVWYFLIKSGQGKGKKYLSYLKNHDETVDLYKDSAGECVMIQVDTNEDGVSQSDHSACGARHGCWTCGAMGSGGDKSMENLIQSDPEKAKSLKPLNEIRNFMVSSYYDLNRRRLTGRTLHDGYIKIAPDCFSADLCRDLLKACLTADYHEAKRAQQHGEKRKFQIINLEQLFAIDWTWSVSGLFHKPFEALKVFWEVYEEQDFFFPGASEVERVSMPKPRYLYVGDSWYQGSYLTKGMANELSGLVGEESSCYQGMVIKSGKHGAKEVQSVVTDEALGVNKEVASFALEYDLESLLNKREVYKGNYAAQYYLSTGLIKLPRKMLSKYDEMLARAQAMNDLGLTGDKGIQEKYDMAISQDEFKSLRLYGVTRHIEDNLTSQLDMFSSAA